MRTGQRLIMDHQSNKVIVETSHDYSDVVKSVKRLKDAGITDAHHMSDSKHVGRIPMDLLTEWIKEAGLQWSDTEEVREMVRSKMLSGEFDKLRVWEGSY